MVWPVGGGIWAVVRAAMLVASVMLVGSLVRSLVLALVGAALQDAKKAGLQPDSWPAWAAKTSYVPFRRDRERPRSVRRVPRA